MHVWLPPHKTYIYNKTGVYALCNIIEWYQIVHLVLSKHDNEYNTGMYMYLRGKGAGVRAPPPPPPPTHTLAKSYLCHLLFTILLAGELGSCYDTTTDCNCDSGMTDLREDNGWITSRTTLPVIQLRAGKTDGIKISYMKLSKMECFKEGEKTMTMPHLDIILPLMSNAAITPWN